MKIVITGALGHIGSYVSRLLPVQFPGVEIIMIDNMMTQRFPSLFNLPSIGKYQFINEDVTKIDLNKIFLNVDVVIHLAAITDASGTVDKAEELEANNFPLVILPNFVKLLPLFLLISKFKLAG